MNKANFFLIGAPKAGTTSIDRVLRDHDDVYLSPIKEPCFFCKDIRMEVREEYLKQAPNININEYLQKYDKEIIHQYFIEDFEDYEKLLDCTEKKVVGECSTHYMASRVAAQNIYNYNPDAKIVAILRDPVDRIVSHYKMDIRSGVVKDRLIDLVRKEDALGETANYGNSRYYLGASQYRRHLKKYFDTFPAKNIKIIHFESIIEDPIKQINDLYKFLGIKECPPDFLPRENSSRSVRFIKINRLLHATGLKPKISRLAKDKLPESLKQKIKKIYFTNEDGANIEQEEIEEIRSIIEKKWQSYYLFD